MPKLVWRVKLVAELEPGVATETEVARIERGEEAGLADLGLRLEEAKRLTASLQAEIVTAQVTAVGERRRWCAACGQPLSGKGITGRPSARCSARLCRSRSGGGWPAPARARASRRASPPSTSAAARSRPSSPTSPPGMLRWRPSARSPRSWPSCSRSAGRRTRARCGTGRGGSVRRWCSRTRPRPRGGPWRGRPDPSWSGSTAATCAAGMARKSATSRSSRAR